MKVHKGIKISVTVIVVLAATAYLFRMPIMLHALGIQTDIQHPRAPNRPVPWMQGPAQAAVPANQRPPNVIVIMADDLGFNDVSMYGHGMPRHPTPHIEALAREGVRFDNGYSANGTCAPSRAALMTGRYASRFGFEFTPIPGNMAKMAPRIADKTRIRQIITHPELADSVGDYNQLGMPPSEITLAEILKARGYHTVHIGKWHLGGLKDTRPNNQGFDESLYMESGLYLPEDDPQVVNSKQDFDPIDKFLWPNMRYATSYNGGEWFEPKGYLTDYYTDEAINAIHANRNQPFFIYLAHWAVHTPLQASKADYDALSDIPDHRERVYAAMMLALDRSVGRVMQALKDEGLDDNTLVIFTGDNGAPSYIGLPNVNKPYRGWKMTLFEGGVHVPYAAKWPAVIPAGSVYDHPVSSIDILPTVVAAAGAELPKDRSIDGVNLLPYLNKTKTGAPHDAIFWSDGDYKMVIANGWKLQVSGRLKKSWLFHLEVDPTEQVNLVDKETAKTNELKALLDTHNKEMVKPAWPSLIEAPIAIDKTLDQPESPDDEYVYWNN